ncbi:MAG: hypothetical protein ABI863_13260 [Ginsengibacter sp.]
MSENLHNIDKLFRRAIEEHEEEPSSNVWEAIDKSLDKKKVVSLSKKYNKLKWAAAVLLLFCTGMATYIFHLHGTNNELARKNNIGRDSKGHQKNVLKDEKEGLLINGNNDSGMNTSGTDSNGKKLNNNFSETKNPAGNDDKKSTGNNVNYFNKTDTGNTALNSKGGINKKQYFPTVDTDRKDVTVNFTEKNNKSIAASNKEQSFSRINAAIQTATEDRDMRPENMKKKIKESTAKSEVVGFDKSKPIEPSITNYHGKQPNIIGCPVKIISQINQAEQLLILSSIDPRTILLQQLSSNTSAITAKTNREKNKTAKINTGKIIKEPLLSATVFFSPEFIDDDIKSDHPMFREDDRNEIRKDEKLKIATNFGALIGHNISKNLRLQTGASLFTKVTNINSKTIYARTNNNGYADYRLSCSSGALYIPLKSGSHPVQGDSTQVSAENTLQYIAIPLVLQYRFIRGKLSISPGLGVAINILSKSTIETELSIFNGEENSIDNRRGLKSSYFNTSLSIGAEYKLSKRIALSLVPVARFALSPINKDAPVKTSLNTFGLATGLTFKL